MPADTKKSPFDSLQKIRTVESQEEKRGRGQPKKPNAKRNNPEWRPWTGHLKRETVIEAEYQLKRMQDGRTVSDLLEELLSGWVAKRKQ